MLKKCKIPCAPSLSVIQSVRYPYTSQSFSGIPIMLKTFIALGALVMSSFVSACPEYLQGEYRKLHSQKNIDLCELTKGKPVLVVNTASHCGFTSQFKGLEALHQQYKDKGLVIVGFASNDFNQEDADEEKAAEICFLNFGVTFTMFSPTHVKGKEANNLFTHLAKESTAPKWNFNKYLLDSQGNFVKHFGSMTKPDSKSLTDEIDKLLVAKE
jgi:glutathione peroxidase